MKEREGERERGAHVSERGTAGERERYGVATISRLLKIIGLFCKISSLLEGSFEKETYYFKV